ncbi:anthranilate synthase component I family protein [Parvularcula sp. ZS-1/3]|uniref:Anthranilate synthase component I family protein n=1 Tax=Parvularcula mediterranea TaxID=2732508 RepID=A0A7Y3W5M6_9PROT|nr:anthranilate synthase component I family protein [Parvularcula mediterranea]
MDGRIPRRAILAAGFAGQAVELSAPRDIFSCRYEDLRHVDVCGVLREAEGALEDGETLAGFLSYECAMAVEPGLDLPAPPLDLPAAWFATFRKQSGWSEDGPQPNPPGAAIDHGDSAALYAAKAEDVRRRIGAGDVFQVNVSHLQSARYEATGGDLIDSLPWEKAISARFGALFDLGEWAVLSASPELFLSVERRTIVSEPIKGTRPRGLTQAEDEALARELEADPKDRAENIMIADLMRNDLAKVCRDGSIREPVICGLRTLPAVHHLYSRIEGKLREGQLFADALRTAFPCGSVTGAPKLAAMDAIAGIEGEGRGPYCGTVFAITKDRAVASVAIRTAAIDLAAGRVDVRSGGGVTILSDPQAEYQEALDKGYLFRLLTEGA